MAVIDHSATYTSFRLKDIPHRWRLKTIKKLLSRADIGTPNSVFDIGCSNGFITAYLNKHFTPAVIVGCDYSDALIEIARSRHPGIKFRKIDLNRNESVSDTADLVTCFETLEHVGNLEQAVSNIYNLCSDDGSVLISVPVEIGVIGTVKYLLKIYIYRYSLEELGTNISRKDYLSSLLKNNDISRFRKEKDNWGTHFGFDYRFLEKKLEKKFTFNYAKTIGTTKFYVLKKIL